MRDRDETDFILKNSVAGAAEAILYSLYLHKIYFRPIYFTSLPAS